MPLEGVHVVVVDYLEIVGLPLLEVRALNFPPELSESGQSRGSHPNDEMFVLGVNPLQLLTVSTSLEFFAHIIRPSDTFFIDGYSIGQRIIRVELVGIVKDTLGN